MRTITTSVLCSVPPLQQVTESMSRMIPSRSLSKLLPWVIALCAALVVSTPALAQGQQEVSGTVTDASDGTTLPGVNISVQGTMRGTTTNVDGEYSLTVPGPDAVLVFSFVGYDTREITVGDRSVIDVALQPTTQALEELVVVGYGEQQQRDVTGVVQKVNPEDFNQAPVVSPEQLISGKVAGVQISSSSGAPGSQTYIRIRGATSVNADSQPLFVVDGVPISNEPNTAGRNPLNFLNPSDIASVTVLKDASATAIYGSRGANGVIIIETKSAEGDEARISYNASISSANVADRIDVLDADQFRQVVSEQAPGQANLLGDASTDWQDAVQRTAIGQEHSLSFSRNYDDSDLRLSLGYLNQEGILQTSETERLSVAIKYNQLLFDGDLSIRTSVKGSQTEDSFVPGGVIGGAASFDPTQPIRDVNSEFGGFYEWDGPGQGLAENNPVAEFIMTDNIGTNYRSLGSIEAEYDLPYIEGLSARLNLGYDVTTGEREFFAPTNLKGQAESANPGLVERANFSRLNTLLDAFLTYDQRFDQIDSRFDVTAGYSYQEFHEEYPEFSAEALTSNIFGPNSTEPGTEFTTFVTEIPSRLISGFARVNYTFMDRYLLTFTVRRDGSSRFGPANQWGTFPSAALAWRAHQESFLQDIETISNFKVRASWGITGNQEIGDFLYEPLWVPGGPRAQIQFGDRFVSTIRPNAADEALKWEETTSYNIGVDYGLFEGRISGSFEYYLKDTDDLLFTVPVAAGANLSNRVLTNIGSMRNQGFEFSVNAQAIQREDFTYTANLNISTNDNELLQLNRSDDPNFQGIDTGGISGGVGNTIQILREGEPVNSFFVFQHKMDENGDPIYEDVNGDGTINQQDLYEDINEDGVINEDDRVVDGSPQPDWIIGHTSQVRYRGFDLSLTLRAHLGQQVYNNVASNFGHFERLTEFVPSNLHESVLETGFVSPQYFSDIYVEDASFLRLDNVALGYTVRSLPGVNQLRIYGTISNAFVLTGYDGTDPEVGGPGSSGIGIDNNVYPRSRTFTAGINVQF